jgi:hypothetical protein
MRVFGRTTNELGVQTWTVVETDANGYNDFVYLTALAQELKLNLGESPFWANRGIPAKQSVVQQVAPDYYTMLMQQRYAPYFMSISIAKAPLTYTKGGLYSPAYNISVTTHYGVVFQTSVPI